MPDTPCLHCELTVLAQRLGDQQHLSANEVAFHVTEVLADIISGIGSRLGRRQMTHSVKEELDRMIKHHVGLRAAHGVPPHEECLTH